MVFLIDLYNLINTLESRINGNVSISVSIKHLRVEFKAIWGRENLIISQQIDIIDAAQSRLDISPWLKLFVEACNEGYRIHIAKQLVKENENGR